MPNASGHGLSLKLEGLDATNDKAAKRMIVIHGAGYESEKSGTVGRSLGCFALDPNLVRGVIEQIRGGRMLLADQRTIG